jgi:hypothetical protein
MDLGPTLGHHFVIGGMGLGTTDSPQGNDDAGCKRPNARKGCRICLCPSQSLGTCGEHHPRRLKALMESIRAAAGTLPTQTAKTDHLNAYGLKECGSLYADLLVDEWDALPHDPFHLWVMGLLSLFLSLVAQSLTADALDELNWLLFHAKPWFWTGSVPTFQLTSGQGTTRRNLKGRGEDLRKQIQLLPLVLTDWLTFQKFTPRTWGKELKEKHGGEEAACTVMRNVCAHARVRWHLRTHFALFPLLTMMFIIVFTLFFYAGGERDGKGVPFRVRGVICKHTDRAGGAARMCPSCKSVNARVF